MVASFKFNSVARRAGLFAGVFLCAAFFVGPGTPSAEPVAITVTKIPLQPGEDADGAPVLRAGSLLYRGGLRLVSADNRFGGLSALYVSDDGDELVALSDDGVRLDARLSYGGDGWLSGLHDATLKPLLDLEGKPLKRKVVRDAESLVRERTGDFLVGFEHRHRIWRYPRNGTPRTVRAPADLSAAPRNQGIEAMTRLSDGRLLLITEGFRGEAGLVRGWLGTPDRWQPIAYQPDRGYRPTAAATLPNGDVAVIERWASRLAGISIRIKRIKAAAITPGRTIDTEELALIEKPMNVDNFEGIAARRDRQGRTLIYIVSDDNFSILQRTLLLMFELEG